MAKVPDSTELTKAFLAQITGTNEADWKRTKKEKVGDDIHRTLAHRDGREAVVCYRNGAKEPYYSGYTIVSLNVPKVHKFEAQENEDFTGNIIFEIADSEEQGDEELVFYCGHETEEGYIDDQHSPEIEDTIKAVLIAAGFNENRLDIGAAESYHMIDLKGSSREETWEKVKTALIAAGAKEKSK